MTTKELAQKIGCSRATLDRVLNGRDGVSEKKRREILHRIEEYGYRPNNIGKMLALQKKAKLAVILAADLTPAENPLFELIERGMMEAVDVLKDNGVQFMFSHSRYGQSWEQVELINEQVEQGARGIAISVEESTPELIRTIKRHMDNGVQFVSFFNINGTAGSDLEFGCRIGTDQVKEGAAAAALLAKFMGRKGNVALFSGLEKNAVHQIRIQTVHRVLEEKYPGMRVVRKFTGAYPESAVVEQCEALFREFPEVNGIVASCGSIAAITDYLARSGRSEDTTVIYFDLTQAALDALHSRRVDAVIGADIADLGYKTIHALYHLTFRGMVSPNLLRIPLLVQIPEILDPFGVH